MRDLEAASSPENRAWPVSRAPMVLAAVTGIFALVGCADAAPDAYGNFEALEVVVSAEVGGTLLRMDAREGDRLAAGVPIGRIDTTQIALQLEELRSQRSAGAAQSEQSGAQVRALEIELRSAERELERVRRLYDAEAATQRQLEQSLERVEVLRERIRAADLQTAGSRQQTGATEARIAQLEDRLARSRVVNPITGTVLTTYARAGELVQPGQPLYRVANLDTLELRAYVTGAQLGQVAIGDVVQVRVDAARGELRELEGTVTWIASRAEFTPTPIQTRDERVDLVYAVKVLVPNPDGMLKIGMPAEVVLGRSPGVEG